MAASAEPSVSRLLAEAMHGLPYSALPVAVVEHARRLAIDTRMVALAGGTQPDVEAVAALIRRNGGIAQSPLWRCGTRVPAAEAAFANALAASALTHPVVWWIIANPRGPVPAPYRFALAEAFAVGVEAWWFARETTWRRALVASLAANATSVALGLASRSLFGLP